VSGITVKYHRILYYTNRSTRIGGLFTPLKESPTRAGVAKKTTATGYFPDRGAQGPQNVTSRLARLSIHRDDDKGEGGLCTMVSQ
jgi:hypothetical protein